METLRTAKRKWYDTLPVLYVQTFLLLLAGAALGFGMNALCVLIAWLHRDIVLYFDAFQPLELLVLFAAVFIQSSAEEMLCRCFLYGKLLRSYRSPWVAILGTRCSSVLSISAMTASPCFLS